MSYNGLLFGLPAQFLLPPEVGAPLLRVFNPLANRWVVIGGAGLGGEPVILGDSDPPDFVLLGGDIVVIGGR